jgi:hypothetical protein
MLTSSDTYFFKTFGFLRVKNVFNKKELANLKKWFNQDYESYFKKSIQKIIINSLLKNQTFMVPSFADNNLEMLDLLYNKGMFDVARDLLGDNVQYWGSDGSLFSYNSLWHRDTATVANRCKLNIYLNSGGKNSGAFRIIPGTHIIGDEYTNLLGNACAWPEPASLGGLNENALLPNTKSPNKSFFRNLISKNNLPDIPHHIIEFNEGDLLVFDDRALHCVYAPMLPKPRRLITLLFTEYKDADRIIAANSISFDKNSINSELISLKQMECNQYSVNAYPEQLIEFLSKKGRESYISNFRNLKPVTENTYDGLHKEQHSDLKSFLRKNYRPIA